MSNDDDIGHSSCGFIALAMIRDEKIIDDLIFLVPLAIYLHFQ
jgi:hypothetical protein